MDQIIGGQAGSAVARGLDGPGFEEVGRLRREDEQTGDGRAVRPVLVPERHPRVSQQVEPGDGRRPTEERLESIAAEVVHGSGRHGLLVEHVLAAPLLEQPGELWRREIALGGSDPRVVAPTRGSVHVQSSGHHHQQDPNIDASVTRQQHLADHWSDRRLAVVGRDVEKPVFGCIQAFRWNSEHPTRVIDAEEDGTSFGVRKRDQLASELFCVGGQHTSTPESHLLELGATVFARAELIQNLFLGIEHRITPLVGRPASRTVAGNPDSGP